ncbi:MAG: hypothetical protein Q9160_000230 [Pyrenula sp. 1 TL-2023]
MSGAGKKRGNKQRGGGDPTRSQSERTSGREIAGQAGQTGQFDGPPSRGGSLPYVGSRGGRSTSGAGSAASHPQSNAPSASVGERSQVGSPGTSPRPSQTEFSGTGPASRPTSSHGPLPTAPRTGLDPARDPERRELATDMVRNVDLPAIAFNYNREVTMSNKPALLNGEQDWLEQWLYRSVVAYNPVLGLRCAYSFDMMKILRVACNDNPAAMLALE